MIYALSIANIQKINSKSQIMETNPKTEIYRVYYSYGQPDRKGQYQKAYKKVSAISHKEARQKAIESGVDEKRQLHKWYNVLKLKKDNDGK
jgi:hypothetical protein